MIWYFGAYALRLVGEIGPKGKGNSLRFIGHYHPRIYMYVIVYNNNSVVPATCLEKKYYL